jgi:hypothetical protein
MTHQRTRNGRRTPLPKHNGSKPPALDFMQLSSDAITMLRYAKTAQSELLLVAPDAEAKADIEESLARCGDAMSSLITARQNALSRYTPSGGHKPPEAARSA